MSQAFKELDSVKMQRQFVIFDIKNDATALKKVSRGRCNVTILNYEE